MKGLKSIVIIALSLTFVFGAALDSHARGKKGAWGKWWHSPQVIKELNITPLERRRLDQMLVNLKRKEIHKRSQIDSARMEIDSLLGQKRVNERAVKAQTRRASKARAAIAQDKYQFLVQVRKLLGNDRYMRLKRMYQQGKVR